MEKENSYYDDPVGLLPRVLSGEATSDEKRRVEEWLLESAGNQEEYDSFVRLWNITGKSAATDDIDVDREWKKMESAIVLPRKVNFRFVNYWKIAAMIILVSSLAYLAIEVARTGSEKAPADQPLSSTLPDGTRLLLNAGSKVTYKKGFGNNHRNLVLKGEAYFEVSKNKALPFVIAAGSARIQVTGTRFNVKASPRFHHIKVTVTEGTVKVYDAQEPARQILVTAGETGTYDLGSHQVTKQPNADMNDLAWKTGILDFHNTTLNEVAEVLESTFHMTFELDHTLERCTVTVRFENRKLDDVISVLQSTLGLNFQRKGNHFVITGKGCE